MRNARYKYLPHTADVKFVAYGDDFKEALENAALALISTMLKAKKISGSKARPRSVKIKEKASSKENLVWYTLQDILSRIDSKKLNAFKFKVDELSIGSRGTAKITGSLFYKDVDSDNFLLEVKGITAHDLRVDDRPGRCEITVLIDV